MPIPIVILLIICTIIASILLLVLGAVIKKGGHSSAKKVVLTLITLIALFMVGYICSKSGIHPVNVFVFAVLLAILTVCIRFILKNRSSKVIGSAESSKKNSKKKHNCEKQSFSLLSKTRVLVATIAIMTIVTMVIAIVLLSQDKKIELGYTGASSIKQVIGQIERSKNKEMTATDTHYCLDFKYYANQWDKNADWFSDSYCNKGSSMNADVVTTQKTVVVKLFDGSNMAKYTFDADIAYLIGYSFEPSTEKGYGVSIYELKDYLSK